MGKTIKCGVWTLGPEIGRGAYGVVYLARGPQGENAAVKVCLREGVDLSLIHI